MKIAIAGTGYVGLSLAVLLSQHNQVTAVDIIHEKVELINEKKSPIIDKEIEEYLNTKKLNISATTNGEEAYKDADFIIIATPTNYDSTKNNFDTTSVESVIELVQKVNPDAVIVIKSTIPVGYTQKIKEKYHIKSILFSPEFLREGRALYDNLFPSRIIVGTDLNDEQAFEQAKKFIDIERRRRKKGYFFINYGVYRSGSSKTFCKYLSRLKGKLF